ncbi:hypothetical protein LTR94_026982, partial [Friedmanniomyces endolithicus]
MARDLRDLHDVELAGLAAGGGRREFGELVRRHGSAVRGLLRRMGAQPALADDLAQDAFLLAFEKCAEFRGEGTFAAWVKRIAARMYLKRISKEARYVAETETENVAPAVVRLDETVAALAVEELDYPCHGHRESSPVCFAATRTS